MSANVEILTGIAGSGKTHRLIEEYRSALNQCLENRQPGRTLWLSPTNRSRRNVMDTLLGESLPVCFAPNVFTFEAFAEKILQFSSDPVKPLGESAKRVLLRQIIDRLISRNRLKFFTSIASTSGFLDLAVSFVSELKRDEIWPEQFAEACQARGEQNKDRDLLAIYSEYQETLHRHSRYDSEGRFWSARAALEKGERGPFSQLSLVVADGFTDFTHTQYEILGHLAQWTDRIMISLPVEEPLQRTDLFAKSQAALERLERMTESGITISHVPCRKERTDIPPAVQTTAQNLFANPRETPRVPHAEGLEILSVTGQQNEVEILAERVKRLLLQGVPAKDIVVAFRSVDDYSDLIHETFQAAGIPFWCGTGMPLSRVPVIKALLAVIELEIQDWPFERLMGVLDSNYFSPDWNEFDNRRAVRAVSKELRHLSLHSQRSVILKTLKRYLQARERMEAEAQQEDEDSAVADSRSALALLEKVAEVLKPFRQKVTFSAWIDNLLSIAKELGITPNAQPPADADKGNEVQLWQRDRRAWLQLEEILSEMDALEQLFNDESHKISLSEFADQLRDLLNSQSLSLTKFSQGCVPIIDASQVRNLEVPYLFLAGLTEGSFPRNRSDDCMYGEAERRRLNEHGLQLGNRSSQNQDEMLLFYGVVTRARRRLVLSYPSVSASGQPLFPSPYVTALQELFDPDAVKITQVGGLDPVPESDRIFTPADLRIVATAEIASDRAGLFTRMATLTETGATARNILAGMEMALHRFHMRGFTAYEGLLNQSKNLKQLERRYSSGYQFSATEFEAYSLCPFRYFVSELLNIDPLESPETATDYRKRGVVVHEILASIHQRVAEEESSISETTAEELSERFQELVEQELGQRVEESKLQQALTEVERRLLNEWAEAYGQQLGEYLETLRADWDSGPIPFRLEIPFGNVSAEGEDDSENRLESLRLGESEEAIQVQGRIDRIDVGTVDGEPVFNLIDYKTGVPPRFKIEDVQLGRSLQLALYTLAVLRLKITGNDAKPYQMGYWSIKETGFVSGLKKGRKKKSDALEAEELELLAQTLEELLPRLADRIRSGRFPVYSQDSNCTGFCPYNTVCRVQQVRPLEYSLAKYPED